MYMDDNKKQNDINDLDWLLQFNYFKELSREERHDCLLFLRTYCESVIEIMEKQIEKHYEEDTS